MRKLLFIYLSFASLYVYSDDTLHTIIHDTTLVIDTVVMTDALENTETKPLNIFDERLRVLDKNSPMDLAYNDKVQSVIDSYIGRNKALISRMQGVKELYFPMFEQQLDKYSLPLEFKYLAIVESALNPKAKSHSGATGLWQFMYLTGKQYGLNVTSYIDERQDPLKATVAA